jgi:hypothetical protein
VRGNKATSIKTVAVPGLKNGMEYARLGDSDLVVSKICMGTMTFGEVCYVVLCLCCVAVNNWE